MKPFLAGMIALCAVGCSSRAEERLREQQYKIAIEDLKYEITYIERRLLDEDYPQDAARFRADFEIPTARAAIDELLEKGPSALKKPLVVRGIVAPFPVGATDPSIQRLSTTHGIVAEWMEVGEEVAGFYLEMRDGTKHEFPNLLPEPAPTSARDPNFVYSPERRALWEFARATELQNHDDPYVSLELELYEQVIDKQAVKAMGLILRDGSSTAPAPVGYAPSSWWNSNLTGIAN